MRRHQVTFCRKYVRSIAEYQDTTTPIQFGTVLQWKESWGLEDESITWCAEISEELQKAIFSYIKEMSSEHSDNMSFTGITENIVDG